MNIGIEQNINAHNRIATEYENRHPEIFNDIEQERLAQSLEEAVLEIRTETEPKKALDYGCGSGNLTRHLLALGLYVVSADLSENFLEIIRNRYVSSNKNHTLMINGEDLSEITDNTFDMVAIYSVLHHVPDYLRIVREFARVTKPGGIIYLDREVNENYWQPSGVYKEFLSKVGPRKKSFWRFFRLKNYIHKVKQFINPRYEEEGDIHVFPDDHIEWDKIEIVLRESGCSIVRATDYLLARPQYDANLYNEYRNKCSDSRCLIARKNVD